MSDFLGQIHSWLNLYFKQRGDLLPCWTVSRTQLPGSGQQTHPGGRLWKRGDPLLPQILQLQLVFTGNLLFGVDDLT